MSGGIDNGSSYSCLTLVDVSTFPFEDLGDRAVVPAFALLLGRYLHGVQKPCNGVSAYALAIHLSDGGNGASLCPVVYIRTESNRLDSWLFDQYVAASIEIIGLRLIFHQP